MNAFEEMPKGTWLRRKAKDPNAEVTEIRLYQVKGHVMIGEFWWLVVFQGESVFAVPPSTMEKVGIADGVDQ